MSRGFLSFGYLLPVVDVKCLLRANPLLNTFFLRFISPAPACVDLLQMEDACLLLTLLHPAQHPLHQSQ